MSDYNIGVVVEGKTDRIVIEAALNNILAGRTWTLTQLQPESSDALANGGYGSSGAGWGGVYKWCGQVVSMGGELASHPSLQRFDFIIIHLDADVSEKSYSDYNITNPVNDDLPCAKPCPPASDSVKALEKVVCGWLGTKQIPRSFVMCVPSKCIEAWVGVALYGQEDISIPHNIECKSDIENYLAQKPAEQRLIKNKSGKMKKIPGKYSEKSEQITSQWDYITRNCGQAGIFAENILAAVKQAITSL